MQQIILYTKKIELKFDKKSVSIVELDTLIEEIKKDYNLIDNNPIIATQDNSLLLTFKVSIKTENKPLGFNFTTGIPSKKGK